AKFVFGVWQTHFDPENLTNSVFDCLNIARSELSLAIHLLHNSFEIFSGKGINLDANFISDLNQTKPRFRNENAHPEMLRENQCRYFAICRYNITYLDA